mgnify:FL=1|jgi:hypothetical protein
MRLVAQIPHPHLRIVIHDYNGRWILEFEGGRCKQSMKWEKEFMDLEKLQKEVIPGLIENVMNRMHQMHEDINRLK